MNVDYKKLAQGLYDLMPDDDKSVLAFGMIPKQWNDMASDAFRKSLAEQHKKVAEALLFDYESNGGSFSDGKNHDVLELTMVYVSDANEVARMIKHEVVEKFERELAVELLRIGCVR